MNGLPCSTKPKLRTSGWTKQTSTLLFKCSRGRTRLLRLIQHMVMNSVLSVLRKPLIPVLFPSATLSWLQLWSLPAMRLSRRTKCLWSVRAKAKVGSLPPLPTTSYHFKKSLLSTQSSLIQSFIRETTLNTLSCGDI